MERLRTNQTLEARERVSDYSLAWKKEVIVIVNGISMSINGGFSLIELLIAIFLGALLMIRLIKLYLGFRNNMWWENTVATLQERGRFAAYFLSQRIH